MKTTRTARKMFDSMIGLAAVLAFAAPFNSAMAQDSAFLACGQYSDRGKRIACLEDALEAAMATRDTPLAQPAPPVTRNSAVADAPVTTPAAAPVRADAPIAAPAAPVTENDQSFLDRLRNFGKGETANTDASASVSTDADGQDQLHDIITKLEKRNNLWIVTLSSGQVWKQAFPRTLNLREGDEISIYQAGIGNGYRLATSRLSGFIRVERSQ